ncbi:MAG: 1-acyl-sn-glycerol-3-phosphate acyltransferase [Planctomycetales bacterium]|nr:1-acyl-sn-glycerol-3-phosphate acyltransferase [Planctomycetales bacterium]
MNRQPYEKPPRWWSPQLSQGWVNFWRPFRKREQLRNQGLLAVETHGASSVRDLLEQQYGVLITPNHCSHADGFTLYEAADQIGRPIFAMMAWQVFARGGWLRQKILRHHGAFSVDREGTDMSALRKAREVLQSEPFPLAIFPEGEVYHLNERLTPFRDGPAALAMMAAKKGNRPIACVPCSMRYYYVHDPTHQLLELMDRLEESLHWRPRRHLKLSDRIYHLAQGAIALKEIEILGHSCSGSLPDRIHGLIEFLLGRIENQHSLPGHSKSIPERVKAARHAVIAKLESLTATDPDCEKLHDELDDLFLVIQAFSYPGDYVSENPTLERIAETLDKFEEDFLGVKTAAIRGRRRAVVRFGEPIVLQSSAKPEYAVHELTLQLERQVREMLLIND